MTMAELAKIPDDAFAELLDSIGSSDTQHVDPRRANLRGFVALVSSFDTASLPTLPVGDDVLEEFLVNDCERVFTRTGNQWSLRLDVRVATLRALDSDGRLTAFDGANDLSDVACVMARRYVAGDAPPLKEQSVEELQGTATASEWLSGTSIHLPSPVEARAQQLIESMLRPLRMLVADGFFGRTGELEMLTDYAEVLPPSSRRAGAVRRVKRILNLTDKPPILIHGPGGVGKSTLVAKFVLDHVDAGEAYRFPFAYLSFDRSELRLEQPLTLLAEAATQLAALFPQVSGDATALAQSARASVTSVLASSSDRRAAKGSWSVAMAYTSGDESVLVQRFAALIEAATGTRDLPNVWVLDAFEVAQRQSPAAIDRLWVFLERLQTVCPRFRVVICGRVPMDVHRTIALSLGDLDPASAGELLRMQLAPLGLPEAFIASVADAVPPQPLSLRLAVLLIRREAERGLATDDRQRQVLFQLQGDNVLGVLYRRILDHVGDPDVRKLAHPGLVVRRVTADVIQRVLAKPCGLGTLDDSEARTLFEKLRREVAIVIPAGPDTLTQRSELRRLMLPMMTKNSPQLVAQLRRAALAYYRDRKSFEDKIEELYYRFSLGQATETLDEAFDSDAARELEDAIEDFPASSRVYLANRLGLTVSPDILKEADDLSWARQAILTSRRYLDTGDAAAALEIVRSRRSDVVYPLTAAIEVEALASMKRVDEALATARSVMDWATNHHAPDTFIDVALLAARIAEDAGESDQALEWLSQVDSVAAAVEDKIAGWVARVGIVRVHRKAGSSTSKQALKVREGLISDVDQLTSRDRSRNPALVRDLAAEIGEEVPSVARDALRLGGYKDPATSVQPRRKRRKVEPPLTHSEWGRVFAKEIDVDVSGSVSKRVSEEFRFESDESAF
ncbi:AAA family ATPase [Arthrobacter humicola]|uniref:AAA family ATPase n=1 Tax=Arthrobacter humicola TaxID=409291 RepID=UPI001FAC3081|nr:AAA family ATPase [Arthrobacter humicola]MCI9870577.1 ATP-binding protein [Arthrobacter humicola]